MSWAQRTPRGLLTARGGSYQPPVSAPQKAALLCPALAAASPIKAAPLFPLETGAGRAAGAGLRGAHRRAGPAVATCLARA